MKEVKKSIITALFLILPLVFGTIGQMQAGEMLLEAAFSTLTMYALNFSEPARNGLVELARWTAPLATAGGVAMLFAPVARAVLARVNKLLGDSVIVYGDEEVYDRMKEDGRYHVARGKGDLLAADRYVLFGSEEENLDFYLKHRDALEKREVYLRCKALSSQLTAGSRLHLYCMEEVGARLFWRQSELVRQYAEKLSSSGDKTMHLVIVGFDRLGEELLTWGLQCNLFLPEQELHYTIFGDGGTFCSLHHELRSIRKDTVTFMDTPWSGSLDVLQNADRIIVAEQSNQLALVQEILFALTGKTLDVLAAKPEDLALIENQERLRIFNWKEEALRPENLFDEKTLGRAKAINLRYAYLYSKVEETPENAEREWQKLNAFTRYSNISAADYHEIRLQQLALWGEQDDPKRILPEHLEILSELEHMRWCRYHYLNNWKYGEPVNGKAKNTAARTHSDLVDYSTLTDEEKEKDRENVRVLLQIDKS